MKFEKLKNIIEVKKGKKPSFVDTPDESSIRVLQIDDLRNDTSPKFTNEKSGVFANEDDVLIAWDGANAGTIGYGKSGYIGSTIALLRKKKPDLYSTTFIGIFLQSQYQYLRSKTTGATIPHISRKALDELEVPVISVSDQLHIANLLSKAENLITQRKKSIRLLDEFLKSTFLEMFGSTEVMRKVKFEKLSDYIDFLTSGSRGWAQYYTNSGAKFLRIQNVWKGTLRTDDMQYVDAPKTQEAIRTRVQEGDLLITITADLGRTAVVPKNFGEAFINQHIALIRLNKKVNPTYAAYYYFMPFGNSAIQKRNRSAVKAGLTFNDIKCLPIIVPDITLQTQFAHIVEKTEALKTQYQQSLNELETLYGSLSQKAFRGELKIKGEEFSYAKAVEDKLALAAEGESSYLKKKRSGH